MLYYCFVGMSHPPMPNAVLGVHVIFDCGPSSTSRAISCCTWLLLCANKFNGVPAVVCPPGNVSKTFAATVPVHKAAPSVRDNGINPGFIKYRA